MESSNEDSSTSFSSCVAANNAASDSTDSKVKTEARCMTPGGPDADQNSSEIEWTPELEILLFRQLRHHRPIGFARHLQMMLIVEKFSNAIGRPVSAKCLWDRIKTYYNLAMLDESEHQDEAPPNGDFDLEPTSAFADLQAKPFPRAVESDSDLDQPLAACIPSAAHHLATRFSCQESDAQSMSTDALSISNMGESSRASTPGPVFPGVPSSANVTSSSQRRQTRNKRSAAPDEGSDSKASKPAGTPLSTASSSTMSAPITVITGNSGRSNRKRTSKN